MENLTNTIFWKKKYGVLPLHLNDVSEERYLMLNGGNIDFCLQIFEENNIKLFKQYAWSSNTKNYLVVEKDIIRVVNWLEDKADTLKKETVLNNMDKFHEYLLRKSYKTENDVIPFVLHVFRKLRSTTNEKHSPVEALNLLFQLLMKLDEDANPNVFYNFEKVRLHDSFEHHLDILKEGVRSIKPNLDIILRHVSGALFEEAHKEVVYFDNQLELFGGGSSKQITLLNQYSSVHYTPAYIARSIVENSLKEIDLTKSSLKIMDPSCGSSIFLIEALKQLKNINYNGEITIEALDISETAIQTSNFLLHYENTTQWNGRLKLKIRQVNNSLEEDWGNDIDLLLMNPPFISWELLKNKEARDVLLDVLDRNLKDKAKPNLASGFLYKAIQSLGKDGVVGCIMPTSIFTFESYNKLRGEIKDMINLKLLAKLGNYAFENALTDVSIFVGKRPFSTNIPQIIWTNNEKGIVSESLRELRKMQANNEIANIDKNYNIYTPKRFPIMVESWKLVNQQEEKLIDKLEIAVAQKRLDRTINVFTVKQGIRQGARDIFKVSREQVDNKKYRDYFRPVVDNSSIKKGVLDDSTYIWYPYDKDGMIFKNEHEIAQINNTFYDKVLLPNKNTLSNRSGISEWWGHTRPRNWQFEKYPKLVSTEFGKSDSFAFDAKGEYVVERGNAWIPKKEFEEDDYYFYLALFSSSMFDRLLNIYAKPILSGFNLGAISTKNIPIPNLEIAKENISSYQRLSMLGRELSQGNTDALYSINEEVKSYYP